MKNWSQCLLLIVSDSCSAVLMSCVHNHNKHDCLEGKWMCIQTRIHLSLSWLCLEMNLYEKAELQQTIVNVTTFSNYRTLWNFWHYWSYRGQCYCTNTIIIKNLPTLTVIQILLACYKRACFSCLVWLICMHLLNYHSANSKLKFWCKFIYLIHDVRVSQGVLLSAVQYGARRQLPPIINKFIFTSWKPLIQQLHTENGTTLGHEQYAGQILKLGSSGEHTNGAF